MCYSHKTNYKLFSKPITINALCALHLLHGQHQRDSWIRPKRVWECLLSQILLQPWFCLWVHPSQRVMVEYKHVLLHIPIRKSHMVSCMGILEAKSVVPNLWAPCVKSNVEAMFHLETDELGCANVTVLRFAEKWNLQSLHSVVGIANPAAFHDRNFP